MISMFFGGGLGNQMFQYAFLYSKLYSKKENNIKAIMHRNSQEDWRELTLNKYNCSIKLNIVDEGKAGCKYKVYNIKRKVTYHFLKKLHINNGKLVQIMSKLGMVFAPDIYGYYPELEMERKNTIVEGAFQNWRYFDSLKENLCREFTPKEKLNSECTKLIKMMLESNSVCVHIRRGDYLNSHYAPFLSICDDNYYKEAISIIERNIEKPEFFVFTNTHEDHIWIQENYHFTGKVHYVDMGNPDYIELFLMSKCKNFIISNSTFSWWAQYLAQNKDKLIVAPSIWYRGNDESKQIYMPNWKLVEVK